MVGGRFQEFCIVGLGGHALTKLVPAIQANGQVVTATVDNRTTATVANAVAYRDVSQALAALPHHTVFFLATPPGTHFALAREITARGFDMFIEKPAFVTRVDAEAVARASREHEAVLVEGLMHRFAALHAALVQHWSASRERITSIVIRFLIPAMPPGTFRNKTDLFSASIFDMGCYPVSLLFDLGLAGAAFEINEVRFPGNPDKEMVSLEARHYGITIAAEIGVAPEYENSVEFITADGAKTKFAPYFYGRAGGKQISSSVDNITQIRLLADHSAFEAMLAVPRDAWLHNQTARSLEMVEQAAALEALAKKLRAARTGNPHGIGLGGTMG